MEAPTPQEILMAVRHLSNLIGVSVVDITEAIKPKMLENMKRNKDTDLEG